MVSPHAVARFLEIGSGRVSSDVISLTLETIVRSGIVVHCATSAPRNGRKLEVRSVTPIGRRKMPYFGIIKKGPRRSSHNERPAE